MASTCDAMTYGYFPSHRTSTPFGWYQFILVGEQIEAHVCEQLAEGRYIRERERLGLKSATSWLQVRCHNHYATKPHLKLLGP